MDVVLEDLFFLGVALEVLFETLIANDLLFELKELLISHALVRESAEHLFDSALHFHDFVPDDWDALQDVISSKSLLHLLAIGSEHLVLLLFFRCYQVDYRPF